MRRYLSVAAMFFLVWSVSGAQYVGTYYNGIDTAASTFVNDLHNRLTATHVHVTYIDYKTTIIPNYESRDTTNGRKVVTCVYSGMNFIYTPPFAWIGGTAGSGLVGSDSGFSREHTWCHNWMPTNPANSPERDEYADQHHLFPTNQNSVNNIRSDHPLGVVVNVQSSYLEAKLGTNASGQVVYEPRSSHKGDAARALLYMSLRYNGIDGKSWTFRALNDTILPSKSEAPIDLNMLLQWSQQDPPDAWELGRNNYIESVQGNRNPFVDHPSWVNLIDFYTLTKKTAALAAEPTNHATGFSVAAVSDSTISLTWTGATGAQTPSGYLLLGSSSNSFTAPTDGVVMTDDTTLGDGTVQINLGSSATSRKLYGLASGTTYYFQIYSYNGTGSARNYKTGGTVPTASGTTTGLSTEPTNYPTGFSTGTITDSTIQLTWTAAAGSNLPTGYLLQGSTANSFVPPTDGVTMTDDTVLGDGTAQANLSAAASSFVFTGLSKGTTYYFRLYSYAGSSGQRNYKTDGAPPTQYGLTTGSPGGGGQHTPSVAVNEYMNGSTQATEWVELLVLNDGLDVRGMNLRDYSASGGAQTAAVFSQHPLWSAVPKGSFIVVLGNGNNGAQDSSFSDKVVVVSITNRSFFSGTATGFNISGSNDAVEILTAGNTHIHSLSHGGTTRQGLIATLPAPTAYVTTTTNLDSNMVVRFINIGADADFGSDAKVEKSTTLTKGAANDAAEQTFINTQLPVELTAFDVRAAGISAELTWRTASEVHNAGFEIERRSPADPASWRKVGFVQGAGNSDVPRSYAFLDHPGYAGTFVYRLRQTDDDGTASYSPERTVTLADRPHQFLDVYPNPFNPTATIEVRVDQPAHMIVRVYDLLGREAATLHDADAVPGLYRLTWNAAHATSGTYYVRLEQNGRVETRKLLLMR